MRMHADCERLIGKRNIRKGAQIASRGRHPEELACRPDAEEIHSYDVLRSPPGAFQKIGYLTHSSHHAPLFGFGAIAKELCIK